MTGPTPEQLLLAAKNTVRAPRNTAPAVRQAIENDHRDAERYQKLRELEKLRRLHAEAK